MTRAQELRRGAERWVRPVALGGLAAALLLLALSGFADIFNEIVQEQQGGNGAGGLGDFNRAVQNVKGPASVVLGSLVPLGLLVGGGMMAVGNRKGIQVLVSTGGAGAAVLLGNGVAA
jgi:hypothetical protein